jgi:radical SAM superfamily enzyme YgiQ (UPF0313 family)
MKLADISWKVQLRPVPVNREFAKCLYDSGCWLVRVGIESGNNQVLKGIGKGVNIKQVESSCKKLKEAGLKVIGLFMIFNVWEENGELKFENKIMAENTFRFAAKMMRKKLMDGVSWCFTTPLPGSKLFEIANKNRLMNSNDYNLWNQSSNFVMDLPGLDDKDVAYIKMKGMTLQARSILGRGFNPSLIKDYVKKGFLMAKYFTKSI